MFFLVLQKKEQGNKYSGALFSFFLWLHFKTKHE